MDEVLDSAQLPENIALKADKGYQSEKNAAILKERKLKMISIMIIILMK